MLVQSALRHVIEGQLIIRRTLEPLRPSKERLPRDLERADRKIGVALGKSLPEFVDWKVKEA